MLVEGDLKALPTVAAPKGREEAAQSSNNRRGQILLAVRQVIIDAGKFIRRSGTVRRHVLRDGCPVRGESGRRHPGKHPLPGACRVPGFGGLRKRPPGSRRERRERGPGFPAGPGVASGLGQQRTFRAVSWSYDCLRRAQAKKVERLWGRTNRGSAPVLFGGTSSVSSGLRRRKPCRPGRLRRRRPGYPMAIDRGTDRSSFWSWFRTGFRRGGKRRSYGGSWRG